MYIWVSEGFLERMCEIMVTCISGRYNDSWEGRGEWEYMDGIMDGYKCIVTL